MDFEEIIAAIESNVSISSLIGTRSARIQCPFHNSASPDLAIKHHQNKWRCFGACDEGHWLGLTDWVMKTRGCGRSQAFKELAEMAGVQLGVNQDRVSILRRTQNHFNENLENYPEVMKYLKSRGFGEQWAFQRNIGYAGDGTIPDGLTMGQLESVGLVRRNQKGIQPFFRNRIVYPIYDNKSNLTQMQGRRFPELLEYDPMFTPPKYLGLPREVDLRDRSIFECLACEDIALKPHGSNGSYAFLAEGWPDAETLNIWKLPTVGLFGHTGMERHSYKLKKLKYLFVVLDPDKASQENIYSKLYPLALRMPEVEIRNIYLDTNGMDTNAWAMSGKPQGELLDPVKDEAKIDQLRNMVDRSPNLVQELINQWGNNPHLIQPLALLVAVQPDREKWIWYLASKLEVSVESVNLLLKVLASEGM